MSRWNILGFIFSALGILFGYLALDLMFNYGLGLALVGTLVFAPAATCFFLLVAMTFRRAHEVC